MLARWTPESGTWNLGPKALWSEEHCCGCSAVDRTDSKSPRAAKNCNQSAILSILTVSALLHVLTIERELFTIFSLLLLPVIADTA